MKIEHRVNETNPAVKEHYVSEVHMEIDDLKRIYSNDYLSKNVLQNGLKAANWSEVPHYPRPVEFCMGTVAHVTTKDGLDGILGSGGFKGGVKSSLLWWNPVIGPEEITAAEQRYLEKLFPDQTAEEKTGQKPFLHNFTTSPAFQDESRYGNFRFSFSLPDVLQAYSTQFCGGEKPVFRVYETVVFSQEVMYVVLVHSPNVHDYDVYPELGDDEGVCAYQDGKIMWRAQAISETHRFQLNENRDEKQVHVERGNGAFYVWDVVSLALHVPKGSIFEFSHERLKKTALTACGPAYPAINKPLMSLPEAEAIVMEIRATCEYDKSADTTDELKSEGE
ncbi:hypothetical protein ACEWY4_020828 [Coilia grayii]|uniref:Uncharacterized protein n=1 Tax=Coilia grayii TaxID=363190 RepID=A0ABD1J9Q4_9TELE